MLKKFIPSFLTIILAGNVFAQITGTAASAYTKDGTGAILRSQSGLCWRTGNWGTANAAAGCDGDLNVPVANPTAPALVPAAAAEPVAQIPVAPTLPQRCDFSITLSDRVFAFDHANLTDAAKKHIDDALLKPLAACGKISVITITGHTDHLGPEQYNQKLSGQRAGAVSDYLRNTIADAQITASGMGKEQPVKFCDDKLESRKLIECLAPNRRVVIDVHGLAK